MRHLREESKREFDEIDSVNIKPSLSNKEKCKKILDIDDSLRFAGMCSKNGEILAAEYKPGSKPLFPESKTEFSISNKIISALENTVEKDKLGKLMYSVSAFENQKRATFALDDGILFISFAKSGDENKIINKVIYDIGLD